MLRSRALSKTREVEIADSAWSSTSAVGVDFGLLGGVVRLGGREEAEGSGYELRA